MGGNDLVVPHVPSVLISSVGHRVDIATTRVICVISNEYLVRLEHSVRVELHVLAEELKLLLTITNFLAFVSYLSEERFRSLASVFEIGFGTLPVLPVSGSQSMFETCAKGLNENDSTFVQLS